MTDGHATAEASSPAYHYRLVSAALACVWFSVGSVVVGMGLILANEGSHAGLIIVPIIATLLAIPIPGILVALVVGILGGMWRSRADAAVTSILLLAGVSADLMLWPITVSQHWLGYTCTLTCTTGTSDGDLWAGGGVQALLFVILLGCTAYWLSRLLPDTSKQTRQRGLMVAAIACAAILAVIDLNVDGLKTASNAVSGLRGSTGIQSYPATGSATLSNDTSQMALVVYCPHRNCTGRSARPIDPNTDARFTIYATDAEPDSFVVLNGLNGIGCTVVKHGTDGVLFVSLADPSVCDADLATVTVPH